MRQVKPKAGIAAPGWLYRIDRSVPGTRQGLPRRRPTVINRVFPALDGIHEIPVSQGFVLSESNHHITTLIDVQIVQAIHQQANALLRIGN